MWESFPQTDQDPEPQTTPKTTLGCVQSHPLIRKIKKRQQRLYPRLETFERKLKRAEQVFKPGAVINVTGSFV